MELQYIWIKDDNTILKNLNVNFHHSGEQKFSYLEEEGILHLSKTNSNSFHLYFGQNIKGINVIAGKNGVGKSSLCDLIIHSLATIENGGMSWDMAFKGIVCFDNSIFYQKELIIKNSKSLKDQGYLLYPFDETPLQEIFGEESSTNDSIILTRFIYYSNFLDERGFHQLSGLTNISTQYLLFKSIWNSTYLQNSDYIDKNKFDNRFQIDAFHELERDRISRFILKNSDINIPIELKGEIRLKNTFYESNKYLKVDYNESYSQIVNNISFPVKKPKNDGNNIEFSSEFLKNKMIELTKFNVLLLLKKTKKEEFDINRFVFESDYYKNIDSKAALFLDCYINLIRESQVCEIYSKHDLDKIAKTYGNKWNTWFFTIQNLYIDITNDHLVKHLIIAESDFLSHIGLTHVKIFSLQYLQKFSSGEYNYLSFFSRLNFAIAPSHFYEDIEKRHFNLFIDEGEGGFHPDWKKKFFKWVIDYLTKVHPDKTFSLFFTTHSPYLISDIDTQNLILLDKVQGQTRILSKDTYKPFGANIHDLLADTFFMKDGFIGEFAKGKIQTVIDKLNQLIVLKKTTDYNFTLEHQREIENCRKIIDLIGDQFVRNKLIDMYYELVSEDAVIENEIQRLKNRIDLLNRRKR